MVFVFFFNLDESAFLWLPFCSSIFFFFNVYSTVFGSKILVLRLFFLSEIQSKMKAVFLIGEALEYLWAGMSLGACVLCLFPCVMFSASPSGHISPSPHSNKFPLVQLLAAPPLSLSHPHFVGTINCHHVLFQFWAPREIFPHVTGALWGLRNP